MTRAYDPETGARESAEARRDHPEISTSPEQLRASRRTVLAAAAAGTLGMVGTQAAGALAGVHLDQAGQIASSQQDAMPESTPTAGPLPNILVIFPDDVGYWNLSAYNLGVMGYRTPNIDRIASEGVQFTDVYAEQSCTAGRAAFITGQSPIRTGLLSIGMPGDDQGLNAGDPTISELLKPLGYTTGQFGKNHLGDRNEFLPTVHGFDEFFGNLYHLNAEEEPENPEYPDDPEFRQRFGPRGVLHSWATEVDDPTEDPRFGRVGKQQIEDTGPLTKERMETIDEEILEGALGFIDSSHETGDPFFLWFCPTRMHIFTHLKPESEGVTGLGVFPDGMVEHDGHVGQLLQKLDDLGIAENTIVVYATDNGAQVFSWPDGGTTPFRGEKNSNWEGAYRIPMMVRWPEQIPAGRIENGIFSLQDWLPTLLAAAGNPTIKEQLLDGYQAGEKEFRVHLDGFNQLPYLTGEADESAREEFYYFNDDGDLVGLRFGPWKCIFMEQKSDGLDVWFEPLDELRTPRLVNLRADPLERAPVVSSNYDTWLLEHLYMLYPVQDYVARFYQTFAEYPPRRDSELPDRLQQLLERLRGATS